MESIIRDVSGLDETQRRALEDVLGRELHATDRLVINVLQSEAPETAQAAERPRQSLADWTKVYDGLTVGQIDEIDRIAKTRALLTRNLP